MFLKNVPEDQQGAGTQIIFLFSFSFFKQQAAYAVDVLLQL